MKIPNLQAPSSREVPNTKHQMADAPRNWSLKLGASLVLGCWCLVLLSQAQQYSIEWTTTDGGGGTSTGGVYSVRGAIGQPDAGGAMTNGQFSVTGGFWALPQAVQTEGAPTLAITPASPGFATISWTPNPQG